jgi:hypothetical protein
LDFLLAEGLGLGHVLLCSKSNNWLVTSIISDVWTGQPESLAVSSTSTDPLVLFGFNDLTQDPHISAFFFGFPFAAFLWCCGHERDAQRCIAFDLNWLS